MEYTLIVIAFLVFIYFVLRLFREKVQAISLRNTPIGDLLVTLNKEKKIIAPEKEKVVNRTTTDEIWALYDLSKNKENGYIKKLNPVQKYLYHDMSQDYLVKKEGGYIVLTDLGKHILALVRLIDL